MRSSLIIFCFMLLCITAKSQSWQPGHFYDVKGTKSTGFIRVNPGGKGPIKGEGFIEYKETDKDDPIKLSASDLRSFVAGRDSFVVAIAPAAGWAKYDMDFVHVAVDGPIRLFEARGAAGDGGSGVGFSPGIGVGVAGGGGTGGFGGGLGGGISIPIGGRGGHGKGGKAVYYYGANTASMKPLTNENFVDVMTEIMGDEPDVVEKIQTKKYSLRDIDKLLTYFYQTEASHGQ